MLLTNQQIDAFLTGTASIETKISLLLEAYFTLAQHYELLKEKVEKLKEKVEKND